MTTREDAIQSIEKYFDEGRFLEDLGRRVAIPTESQNPDRAASLVEYLYRETSFPDGCVLLTGTGVVPPDDFTLRGGDEVHISIDGIGTLQNTVES